MGHFRTGRNNLLQCKQRNRLVAEYALRGIDRPMGAAVYHFLEALP